MLKNKIASMNSTLKIGIDTEFPIPPSFCRELHITLEVGASWVEKTNVI